MSHEDCYFLSALGTNCNGTTEPSTLQTIISVTAVVFVIIMNS
jgi:hypothetical protein